VVIGVEVIHRAESEGGSAVVCRFVDLATLAARVAETTSAAASGAPKAAGAWFQDMQAHAFEQLSQSNIKAAQQQPRAAALLAAARQNTALWEEEAARRAGDLAELRVENDASIALLRDRMATTEQASRVQAHELSMRLGAQVQTVQRAVSSRAC
jgi:hypothetical protein